MSLERSERFRGSALKLECASRLMGVERVHVCPTRLRSFSQATDGSQAGRLNSDRLVAAIDHPNGSVSGERSRRNLSRQKNWFPKITAIDIFAQLHLSHNARSSVQRKTCYFSGRVQGVGFRYTAQNIAQQFDVRGFVKNLPDGRVQLVMEGPESEMESVVDSIRQRMNSFIGQMQSDLHPATGEFERFRICH